MDVIFLRRLSPTVWSATFCAFAEPGIAHRVPTLVSCFMFCPLLKPGFFISVSLSCHDSCYVFCMSSKSRTDWAFFCWPRSVPIFFFLCRGVGTPTVLLFGPNSRFAFFLCLRSSRIIAPTNLASWHCFTHWQLWGIIQRLDRFSQYHHHMQHPTTGFL